MNAFPRNDQKANIPHEHIHEAAASDSSEGLSRMYLQRRRVRKWWRRLREYKYDPRFRDIIDAMANEFEAAERIQPGAPEEP